jgi:hypothetical protein
MIVPQADTERDPSVAAMPGSGRAAAKRPSARPFWARSLALETPEATTLHWVAVGLVVAALFVPRLLPCVDYPQHLALSDVARRLMSSPGAPEHREYVLNVFTYNGLFHLVVAWISNFLPIETAGRLVVAVSVLGMATGALVLLRTLGRPPTYAALFTPLLFSFSLGWGFANYALASAVAVWASVFVARVALRPNLADAAWVALLGFVCAFAHVLAMIILCVFAAALAVELSFRTAPSPRRAPSTLLHMALRTTLALAPLLVGCVYCIAVYHRQYTWDPNMYRDPTIEGSAPPLWQKALFFGAFALDLFGDATDQIVMWVAIAVMTWAVVLAWRGRAKRVAHAASTAPLGPAAAAPPVVVPFVAMTIAYFATPMVLIGTHLIFPRIGQWVVLSAVLAVPRFPEAKAARALRYVLRLGLVAGVNLFAHCALFAWETNDASALIDDLPPGRQVTAVIWDPWTIAFRNGTLTHLAAYYAARKHGQWAFAFARYLSVPVRFKPNSQPPWPAHGWEFDGEEYDPRCRYARAFPLVIIKAPADIPQDESGESRVRSLVFRQDAKATRLLSHHGRFWAFDTTGLPEDGVL